MATTVNNNLIYREDWVKQLQDRLSEPTKWKDICRVDYTDVRVLNNPYLTDPTVQSLTRGTSYTMQPINETNESVTISTGKILAQFLDRADLAQSDFLQQMELADRQAVLLNEAIENAVYADFASFTDFGSGDISGGSVADTTTITVSSTNIDDIIRHLRRVIRVASGETLLERYGGFIVWRPADLEILEGFMMANGFASADSALRGQIGNGYGGFNYMGFTHYSSNQLTANHVFAGVKNLYHLGILRSTYGQVIVNPYDPNLTSGISVTTRVDYTGKVWTKVKPVLFDVNVA